MRAKVTVSLVLMVLFSVPACGSGGGGAGGGSANLCDLDSWVGVWDIHYQCNSLNGPFEGDFTIRIAHAPAAATLTIEDVDPVTLIPRISLTGIPSSATRC